MEIVEGGRTGSNPISEDNMLHDESKIFPNVRRSLVALQAGALVVVVVVVTQSTLSVCSFRSLYSNITLLYKGTIAH